MIRRVRKQFICITMSMLTTVLIVPLIALNVITEAMSYNQTRNLLEQIAVSEAAVRNNFPDNHIPDQRPEFTETAVSETTTATTFTETSTTSVTSIEAVSATDITTQTKIKTNTKTILQTTMSTSSAKRAKATTYTTTVHVSRETKSIQTTQATKRTTKSIRPPVKTTEQTTVIPVDPDPDWPDPDWPPDWPDPEPWEHDWYFDNEGLAFMQPVNFIQFLSTTMAADQNADKFMIIPTEFPDNQKDSPPLRNKKEPMVTIDHFLCFADTNGVLREISGTDSYTQEDGQEFVDYVLGSGKTDGLYNNLQYYRKDLPDGILIVFSDRSSEQLLMKKLLIVSILVFFCMEGVVLVLTLLLTKRAMKPMQDTFERQRQFISDAGHELKTPLTIISANVDILKDEIGQNKWLIYIQSQTERMGKLIKDMMNLTKLDMRNQQQEFTEFSLSTAVTNAVLPFESQAFEQEKKLILEIQENIQYTGNLEQIKQLTAIFMDNAIKYSNEHGEIRVTLEQNRDKKILKIYNTGQGVTEEEKEKIFERFYRSDSSRSRATGGYGLGLSIAKSIADAHKIKIQVESEYGHWICFVLIF